MNKMSKMKWQYAEEELKDKVVILPIGALEAHGSHLPLGTDNYIAQELAERLTKQINGILLPLLPLGQVWSLRNFPGSISLQTETLISIIEDIAISLERHKVQCLVVVNAHFGNNQSLKKAARNISANNEIEILHLTHPGLKSLENDLIDSKRAHSNYLHAEEIETSLMLNINPDLVNMKEAHPSYPQFPSYFSNYPLFWDQITEDAVLGDPTKATEVKGGKLLNGIVKEMKKIIKEFKREVL
ncbi:uncharacterized protein, putative amidase [Halobacteroides halobius DSM 5150]|uniref:Uncharacterized protein, putative amidase n=1 Tax=Halobacteroides halobius (strain ATCC 35273 / DSM 5150 / MD-1) TaxID=748449 RepID=L0K6W2_HALHC|nr:creatininase family protein [Halobacteroides halobius]AGB40761.1 uncharacterized protein, putative amidase [Halobacteroides halobius DSM 5150]